MRKVTFVGKKNTFIFQDYLISISFSMSCKRKQVNYLIILPLLSVSSSNRKLPMLPNRRLVPKFPGKESQVELVRKIQKRILLFLRKKSVKKSDD